MIYHVGISGGKDSTAVLLWMLHRSGIPRDQIDATFCDTGNEHAWTYAHIKFLSKNVFPITRLKPERSFFELAFHKHRFPSSRARFCTQHLKIYPTQDYLIKLHAKHGKDMVAVSGVRADESDDRATLSEWDLMDVGRPALFLCKQWRPLIRWNIAQVVALHKEYGVPLNPLYGIGAQRVGCFPCIMSRKAEIRNIALRFPERIAAIRKAEQRFLKAYGRYSSFFHAKAVPMRFRSLTCTGRDGRTHKVATIDDVVKWSMTGDRARGRFDDPMLFETKQTISCTTGFCE